MARQNEAFLLTLAAQQKIAQDTSQTMMNAINNLTEKVVLFSKDRTKDSKDRVPARKKNPFPLSFAASNGEDEASAGEGNSSSKDVIVIKEEETSSNANIESGAGLDSYKPHKTVGDKSEPKTLVSSPVQQGTNLTSVEEVNFKRVNKILGIGTKLVPIRQLWINSKGTHPRMKHNQQWLCSL